MRLNYRSGYSSQRWSQRANMNHPPGKGQTGGVKTRHKSDTAFAPSSVKEQHLGATFDIMIFFSFIKFSFINKPSFSAAARITQSGAILANQTARTQSVSLISRADERTSVRSIFPLTDCCGIFDELRSSPCSSTRSGRNPRAGTAHSLSNSLPPTNPSTESIMGQS
jgi:hypothetical protein